MHIIDTPNGMLKYLKKVFSDRKINLKILFIKSGALLTLESWRPRTFLIRITIIIKGNKIKLKWVILVTCQ